MRTARSQERCAPNLEPKYLDDQHSEWRGLGRARFKSRQGTLIASFTDSYRAALIVGPLWLLQTERRYVLPGVKRPERKADHAFPSSVEVNTQNYTFTTYVAIMPFVKVLKKTGIYIMCEILRHTDNYRLHCGT